MHIHPEKRPLGEHAEFVPERFAWAAAFFGLFWAAYHRMWVLSAALLLLNVAIPFLASKHLISSLLAFALNLALFLILGFEGNDMRRRKLAARGYQFSDVVVEDSLLHAQQRYLTRHASSLA